MCVSLSSSSPGLTSFFLAFSSCLFLSCFLYSLSRSVSLFCLSVFRFLSISVCIFFMFFASLSLISPCLHSLLCVSLHHTSLVCMCLNVYVLVPICLHFPSIILVYISFLYISRTPPHLSASPVCIIRCISTLYISLFSSLLYTSLCISPPYIGLHSSSHSSLLVCFLFCTTPSFSQSLFFSLEIFLLRIVCINSFLCISTFPLSLLFFLLPLSFSDVCLFIKYLISIARTVRKI